VLRNFQAIAKAGTSMVSTSIPNGEVGKFMDLALKAKSQKITTVSLVPPAIVTSEPDIAKVREMVQNGIDRSEGTAAKLKKKHRSQTTQGGAIGNLSDGYAANQSDDLASTC
jgi:hypothetical protein